MNHLDYEFRAGSNDTAEVTFDRAANILLMDPANYRNYQNGQKYQYYGGYMTRSPIRIAIPRSGQWHVVVDLGGGAGQVRASVRVLGEVAV